MSFERTLVDIWGTRLSEAECPRRGETVCLRLLGRVYRIERSELRTGQKGGSESEKDHFSVTAN